MSPITKKEETRFWEKKYNFYSKKVLSGGLNVILGIELWKRFMCLNKKVEDKIKLGVCQTDTKLLTQLFKKRVFSSPT